MIKLYNTLSGETEEFQPIVADNVGIYACGPTVYDFIHIGNLRAYIFVDTLNRVLRANNYQIKLVMNVTDVDDKTIKKSGGDKAKFSDLTKMYEEKFWQDIDQLNILRPDVVTKATAYIDKMVAFIEDLIDRGYAYKTTDGSVYFSIKKFSNYGLLARLNKDGLKSGTRVNQDEYDKENPIDFALWKAWNGSDGDIYWETGLGKGRPGWSIECSTMSQDILGDTIDIHTGGIDLIFPHHENEIAQSEAWTGNKFVNYWLHNEHLLVDGKKMSKSLGNYYVLNDLVKKGFDLRAFRHLCLSANYRDKLNFTFESLSASQTAVDRIDRLVAGEGEEDAEAKKQALEIVSNDLATPRLLAFLEQENNPWLWRELEPVHGIKFGKKEVESTGEQKELIFQRDKLRAEGKYAKADAIRTRLEKQGVRIRDTKP